MDRGSNIEIGRRVRVARQSVLSYLARTRFGLAGLQDPDSPGSPGSDTQLGVADARLAEIKINDADVSDHVLAAIFGGENAATN